MTLGLGLLAAAGGCEEEPLEEAVVEEEAPGIGPAETTVEPRTLDDEEIRGAVRAELWVDEAVDRGAIGVDVENGIVTLSGRVPNVIAQRRAIRRAENVRGVRAVIDRIEVAPEERSDEALQADVTQALTVDTTTDAYQLEVAVDDGLVTLTGTADSWQEKMLAEHVAGSVQGVLGVENRIAVELGEERPEGEILADVRSRLEHDVRVDPGLIDVAVNGREVVLTGTVGSAREKSLAASDAWVAGVRDVDASGLDVEPWARDRMRREPAVPEDAQIESAVRDAWLHDPRVASFEPQVSVEDGVATLTGTVDSPAARWAAGRDAATTVGVWRVRNYIRVAPEADLPDAELAENVREAFERDAYLERQELTVSVRDGRVRLEGVVDTAFERRRATEVARAMRGVARVSNDVRVVDGDEEPLADWALEEDIEDRLLWDPRVNAMAVHVEVEDGRATLSGVVEDWVAYTEAFEDAYEAGAEAVVSQLRVRHGPEALQELSEAERERLEREEAALERTEG
jgi:osmotically-inducible protein OsmY